MTRPPAHDPAGADPVAAVTSTGAGTVVAPPAPPDEATTPPRPDEAAAPTDEAADGRGHPDPNHRGDTAAAPPPTPIAGPTFSARIHTVNRPNMVSVGTIVWLSSELMFFAGLFAIYLTIRATNVGEWPPPPSELDVPYALVFTVILVTSSLTCQMGVFAAERGDVFGLRRWYLISLVLGLIFVLGQANEYLTLVTEHDTTISSSAFGSAFYMTTGFHGLHVIGGLLAFAIVIMRTKLSKFTPAQATSAIVVSYYWHFVDIVWIGLFAMIYIIQ